jgi:hypothetical protein
VRTENKTVFPDEQKLCSFWGCDAILPTCWLLHLLALAVFHRILFCIFHKMPCFSGLTSSTPNSSIIIYFLITPKFMYIYIFNYIKYLSPCHFQAAYWQHSQSWMFIFCLLSCFLRILLQLVVWLSKQEIWEFQFISVFPEFCQPFFINISDFHLFISITVTSD